MNRDELKFLLKQMDNSINRQPGCPDDDLVASYMEGGLSERVHGEFELHLTDCAWCLERVGILARTLEHEPESPVPELVQARAVKMAGESEPSGSAWRRAPAWAAAALVVLAVGIVARDQLTAGHTDVVQQHDTRTTRSIDPGALGPSLLSPREGKIITSKTGVFNWTPVAGSLYYDVYIITDAGNQIWAERVTDANQVAVDLRFLPPGAEYFVQVDAYLSNAKTVSSEHVAFTVSKP